MALVEWTKDMELGIAELDAQHRRLVDIVNKFDEAVRSGKGTRVMNGILNELVGYTAEHFAYEESLLERSGYGDLKRHKAQHRQLLQKVERYQYEFNDEGKRVTSQVQELLKYWLTNHILQSDKAYLGDLKPATAEVSAGEPSTV